MRSTTCGPASALVGIFLGAFLGGYRQALKDPDINSSAPSVVSRALE